MNTFRPSPVAPLGLIPRTNSAMPTMEPSGIAESKLYKQAGNAVCVGVVAQVGRALVASATSTQVTCTATPVAVDPAFAPPAW